MIGKIRAVAEQLLKDLGIISAAGAYTVSPSSFSAQTANTSLAGPASGGDATPTFRALVAADVPTVLGTTHSFGGATSSFPALKRNSSQLEVKLADDSAYASMRALFFTCSDGYVISGANSALSWSTKSSIFSPSDGTIKLTNAAANAFSLLQLGGETSSFPALKRSSAALHVRLADDSAFAALFTGGITPAGAITFPTGLGGIAHIDGPSDNTLLIRANSANPGQFWSDGWDYVSNNGLQTLLRMTSTGTVRLLKGQVLQWANSTTNMTTAGSGISIPSDGFFAFGTGADGNVGGGILVATYSTVVASTKTGVTTIDATATVWPCDTSGGDFTITLPSAVGISGRVYVIKQVGASGTLTIDGNGAETIDGAANKTLATQYASYTLVSNGSNWLII